MKQSYESSRFSINQLTYPSAVESNMTRIPPPAVFARSTICSNAFCKLVGKTIFLFAPRVLLLLFSCLVVDMHYYGSLLLHMGKRFMQIDYRSAIKKERD